MKWYERAFGHIFKETMCSTYYLLLVQWDYAPLYQLASQSEKDILQFGASNGMRSYEMCVEICANTLEPPSKQVDLEKWINRCSPCQSFKSNCFLSSAQPESRDGFSNGLTSAFWIILVCQSMLFSQHRLPRFANICHQRSAQHPPSASFPQTMAGCNVGVVICCDGGL